MYLLAGRRSYREAYRLGRALLSCRYVESASPALNVFEARITSARSYAKLVSFPLAQTGEGISECELVSWAVKAGDTVSPFDKLCDIQSDKASIEITSRYGGRILALHHAAGDVVKVGAPLVDMEVPDDEQVAPEHLLTSSHTATQPAEPQQPQQGAATSDTQAAPSSAGGATDGLGPIPGRVGLADGKEGATAAESVGAGKAVNGGTAAAVQAAAVGLTAACADGVVASVVHASPAVRALARELGVELSQVAGSGPGGRVTKPDVLRFRDEALTRNSHPVIPTSTTTTTTAPLYSGSTSRTGALGPGSGSAVSAASGGGAGGGGGGGHPPSSHASQSPVPPHRSVEEVMAEYHRLTGPMAAAGAAAGGGSGDQVVPLRGYRRAMAKSMTAAASVPLFHLHDEVAVDSLLGMREVLRSDPWVRAQGVRLTLLPLLVKALSAALTHHPGINASLASCGTELRLHPDHNIGVAMATPAGLVVPNIKQVQRKSLAAVAAELSLLQTLAGAGRLPPEALTGGTITISNIGTIGGTHASPIVSPPELVIVALGRMQVLPRYPKTHTHGGPGGHGHGVHGGHGHGHGHAHGSGMSTAPPPLPIPVSILPISWGADHRVVDGAALASLALTWKALLEQPERLMLHAV